MTEDVTGRPEINGRSFYGYDSSDVQDSYTGRDIEAEAGFILPHLKPGMSILDCGCGPGAITFGLAEAVAPGRVLGVDIEPAMVEQATRLAAEEGVQNVEFRVGDIYDLPFEDGEFDVVFSHSVTEHLSDPVRALRELRRVVKPGGLAAVVKTDWTFPFIVPESEGFSKFFELFEGGFNRIGGSLNRGR
ncbi:MAG: class I SAM-dependent methyltransferase, partial [Dehalococcoidia bacterium]|nr:class I SAM-dependent methyltransferase [Dehalococcoidia bacterium]